jgi:hypothetical protein
MATRLYQKKETLEAWIWGLLGVGVLIAAGFLLSPTAVADACDGVAWPFLAGKWEPVAVTITASPRLSNELPLQLFLYPGGEAIKNGQRGQWKVVTCGGPTTVLIDLPRRLQTDSCDLQIEDIFKPEQVAGVLTCSGGGRIAVHRTEARGLVSSTLRDNAIEARAKAIRSEQELKHAPAWKKRAVRIEKQVLNWLR